MRVRKRKPPELPSGICLESAAEERALSRPGRFEFWIDPAGGWTVWDTTREAPAELFAAVLIGLEEGEARALCALLNQAAPASPCGDGMDGQVRAGTGSVARDAGSAGAPTRR